MEVQSGKLEGVVLIKPKVYHDERGWFVEAFRESAFEHAAIPTRFVQDNISCSVRGVVRGLHLQREPHAQAKLVRCLQGSIYDVVVDVREGSPTFGQWEAYELNDHNQWSLFVPAGMAHGFQALSDKTVIYYKCSHPYAKESEDGIRYDDPTLSIPWPAPVEGVSQKDLALPMFRDFKAVSVSPPAKRSGPPGYTGNAPSP